MSSYLKQGIDLIIYFCLGWLIAFPLVLSLRKLFFPREIKQLPSHITGFLTVVGLSLSAYAVFGFISLSVSGSHGLPGDHNGVRNNSPRISVVYLMKDSKEFAGTPLKGPITTITH